MNKEKNMAKFNFEKNLAHQSQAVESTIEVFDNVEIKKPEGLDRHCINPQLDYLINTTYANNIVQIHQKNGIDTKIKRNSNIIDIMMETGTGKTYVYTKTIFELNKNYGIFKFIVIVPTLSIKAGAIDFLKSDSSREHFKEQYGKTIHLHIVESKKGNKNKKSMLHAVWNFVNEGVDKDSIQVMIINAGMINSDTMTKSFDMIIFDTYTVPFDAISAIKPFMIIDEPHKFSKDNKTWGNIKKLNPQFILRYGATFIENENLVYTLTAVDSFNQNLVKGVIGHITEFEKGNNTLVKFVNSDGNEASFELFEKRDLKEHKKIFKIGKKESLEKVHSAMTDLCIENLNKSTVVLSNGLELKKGNTINPYAYAETLQNTMIEKVIKHHFELEKKMLTRAVKIKPLTLFFIDNIAEYRNEDGYIKTTVERFIKAEVEVLLKTETNDFYKQYLEKTLEDISKTHGGYFSKDNSEKDEAIEKEINEILHDKQTMLDLNNPRRFVFSKWTLREGWDNPNVFQICKLRSSGSDISKLQEVGRGLRLPVNEYGSRVKDEQFYLNYFVDFTESDFVDTLVNEINEKSGAISIEDIPERLHDEMIRLICEKYTISEDDLLQKLDENNIIKRDNSFKENGFEYIKINYPLIFEGIHSNKICKATDETKKISIRCEKYTALQSLWESINKKVILEYKFGDENAFKALFVKFLKEQENNFEIEGMRERTAKIEIENNRAEVREYERIYGNKTTPISTMKYSEFLKTLARALHINMKTLHQSFVDSNVKINNYLNQSTIRIMKQKFDNYLMCNAINNFSIAYQEVSNTIHPTKFTDENGTVKKEISASDVGVLYSNDTVANNYFFDTLFYDSELEKENIKTNVKEVIVFTKIPKNSIKIPVAGGKSYSPDFAYVLKCNDGKQKLHFIIETKNVNGENSLREEENQKILHAQTFFGDAVKIEFRTQFNNKKITELIHEIVGQ